MQVLIQFFLISEFDERCYGMERLNLSDTSKTPIAERIADIYNVGARRETLNGWVYPEGVAIESINECNQDAQNNLQAEVSGY